MVIQLPRCLVKILNPIRFATSAFLQTLVTCATLFPLLYPCSTAAQSGEVYTVKNVKVDEGDATSLFLSGLYEKIENQFDKISYTINGIKEDIKSYPAEYSVLNFLKSKHKGHNLFSPIDSKLLKSCSSFLKNSKNLTINLSGFYNSPYEKKYTLKKNNTNEKILRNNFHTIIFSPLYDFYDNHRTNQKINLFIDLFKDQKNLNNIVFDFTYNEKDDLQIEYESEHIIFFLKFVSKIREALPNIKIFLYFEKIKELISNSKNKEPFTSHLIIILKRTCL